MLASSTICSATRQIGPPNLQSAFHNTSHTVTPVPNDNKLTSTATVRLPYSSCGEQSFQPQQHNAAAYHRNSAHEIGEIGVLSGPVGGGGSSRGGSIGTSNTVNSGQATTIGLRGGQLRPLKTEAPRQTGPESRVTGRETHNAHGAAANSGAGAAATAAVVPPAATRRWVPPSLRPQHGLSQEAKNDVIFRKVSCHPGVEDTILLFYAYTNLILYSRSAASSTSLRRTSSRS